ncbi:MAG TPA: glycosyltransferase family 4 protein [Bryobacteraceae bacterium]|jgi:glycosyltransferase involved in cell wall biosynthesis
MRILQVHNFYQKPGGEDQVFAAEYELLTSRGHFVMQYSAHNDEIGRISGVRAGVRTIWNRQSYRDVRRLLKEHACDLLHAHNTFPLISPAIYYAAEAERVPVIQTLHNYRLLCPAANLFREGRVCEQCLGSRLAYHAVAHRCYRHSAPASATVSLMLAGHRIAGTWRSKVKTYIALTDFAKGKFIEGGLPEDRLTVKGNFLPVDPGAGSGSGGYALFIGRLAAGKGIGTLLGAWARLGEQLPLKIAGDGPMRESVRKQATQLNIDYLGRCPHAGVIELLKSAELLIFPSLWYEGLPMTIIEALACATPVIASSTGPINELIVDGVNGFRFLPGDADALVDCVRNVLAHPERRAPLRLSARADFEQRYTPERNYQSLMRIYDHALAGMDHL